MAHLELLSAPRHGPLGAPVSATELSSVMNHLELLSAPLHDPLGAPASATELSRIMTCWVRTQLELLPAPRNLVVSLLAWSSCQRWVRTQLELLPAPRNLVVSWLAWSSCQRWVRTQLELLPAPRYDPLEAPVSAASWPTWSSRQRHNHRGMKFSGQSTLRSLHSGTWQRVV